MRQAGGRQNERESGALGGKTIAGRRSAFIHTLTKTGSVALAAGAADRTQSTCYRWRAENPAFAAAWAAALEIGYDRLESALLDHALRTIESVGSAGTGDADNGRENGGGGGEPAGGSLSAADRQFVLNVVLRHRGRSGAGKLAARSEALSREEVDAALRQALDGLALRVRSS